jgi:anthranilate/para-aminobenzoate synthase component I
MKVKGPFLFEGKAGGWFDAKYSLIGLSPFAVFQSKGDRASFEWTKPDGSGEKLLYQNKDPLSLLQNCLNRFKPNLDDPDVHPSWKGLPFLFGGAAGFISYDLARQYEPIPPHREENPLLPDIDMVFINHFILFDHSKKVIHLMYNPAPLIEMGWSEEEACQAGRQKIEGLEDRIKSPDSGNEWTAPVSHGEVGGGAIPTHAAHTEYISMVERAKEYIAAGDIFQANLSHRFHFPFMGESIFSLYQRLQKINPSPFSAYLNMGGIEMASGSPERLVRIKATAAGRLVETRPIAGTCPRGLTPAEDQEKIAALYASAKERAEHLMLVDLERNDIGKVARYGSVKVDAMMTLAQYSHVSHLVSNIMGELPETVSATDVLRALFPGGTITGVPKVRCMQIIAELEKSSRGLYTGSAGYIDFAGEMDMNIVIRSFIRQGKEISFQVGAGIVADSNPEMEYRETLQKAAALLSAIEGGL